MLFQNNINDILGRNLELLSSVRFLFQRYLALIILCFGVHHLCSVLLVRSPTLVVHHYSWPKELLVYHPWILIWTVFCRWNWSRLCCPQFRSMQCTLICVSSDSQNKQLLFLWRELRSVYMYVQQVFCEVWTEFLSTCINFMLQGFDRTL